jgi:hypothetical protein
LSRKTPHLIFSQAGCLLMQGLHGFLCSHLLCHFLTGGTHSGERLGSHCNTVLEPDRRGKGRITVVCIEICLASIRLSSFIPSNFLDTPLCSHSGLGNVVCLSHHQPPLSFGLANQF